MMKVVLRLSCFVAEDDDDDDADSNNGSILE